MSKLFKSFQKFLRLPKAFWKFLKFSRFPKVCSKAPKGFRLPSPSITHSVRPWAARGRGPAGAVRYIPAGGASVRDPGSVELLRDTFMVQLATQTQYCSYRRWIGATTTFRPVGWKNKNDNTCRGRDRDKYCQVNNTLVKHGGNTSITDAHSATDSTLIWRRNVCSQTLHCSSHGLRHSSGKNQKM